MSIKIICFGLLALFASNVASQKPVICYAPTWNLEYLNYLDTTTASYCTHYVISFANITETGSISLPQFSGGNSLSGMITKLKSGGSKVMLAIGGASAGGYAFSVVAANSSLRATFAQNCLNIIQQYCMSGIDIDWEFPQKAWTNGRDDPTNFIRLLRDLRTKLGTPYMLTTAVSGGRWITLNQQVYRMSEIAAQVNYINLMTYDYHADATWDKSGVNFNAPVDADPGLDSILSTITMWSSVGLNKLILGLPFYSRAYKLQNPGTTAVGSPFIIGNQETDENYMEPYRINCVRAESGQYTRVPVKSTGIAAAPYMYNSTHWISHENDDSINKKASIVRTKNLGGVMIWSIDQDDYLGRCDGGCKWRLLKAANYYIGKTYIHC